MSVDRSRLLPRILLTFVVAVVLVAIVAGFFVVGSPLQARLKKADAERESDLATIADAVRTQISSGHGHDPTKLSQIKIQNWQPSSVLKDPETKAPYDFKLIDHLHFQLCANFDTDTAHESQQQLEADRSDSWNGDHTFDRHTRGRNCFNLNVKQ